MLETIQKSLFGPFSFQHTTGSLPARPRAGCHRRACVHRSWDPITTSARPFKASGEVAARGPSSWTTKRWAAAATGAEGRDETAQGGPRSGRGISRASGRGNASWREQKWDGAAGKRRRRRRRGPRGTTETGGRCTATTAVNKAPRRFTRNTECPAVTRSRGRTRRAFTTLYPRPDRPTKGTRSAPRASTCTRLNSCHPWGRGTHRQGSGGGRRGSAAGSARAVWGTPGTSWRGCWTWCPSEPGEPRGRTEPPPNLNPQQTGGGFKWTHTSLLKTIHF